MLLKVCSEDPLHQNPLGCWLKIQIPPRNLHSDPSSGDSDPQQSSRSTCNEGGGGGVEGSCQEWCEVSGREREVPGQR